MLRLRAPHAEDWPAARALLAAESARHAYAERALEVLDAAVRGSAEYRVVVAESGGTPVGVLVYGTTAGAVGAGALYGIAVAERWRRRGTGAELVRHGAEALRAGGARFALAEVPDDESAVGDVLGLLAAAGFREESRVPDFYRDGVALLFLRREL